jgi:hypothetical protein
MQSLFLAPSRVGSPVELYICISGGDYSNSSSLCSDKLYLLDTTNLDDGGNALNWTADPGNVDECRRDLSYQDVSRWVWLCRV